MINDNNFLIHADGAVVHFPDTDTAHIFIVVDGADQYLGRRVRVSFRGRNVVQDGVEQGGHVFPFLFRIQRRVSAFGGCKYERAVQLLFRSVQIDQKLQDLVDDFFWARFRAVDLIDAYDDRQIQVQRFAQHKFGLRHGPFKSVYYQNDAVDHFQDPFHFPAEIGMSGSVYNIDFYTVIKYGGIFGQNRDSAFAFDVIGIHDPFRHFLIGAEYAALFQKLVDQRCLAVVYMSDNCYISYIFTFHSHQPPN